MFPDNSRCSCDFRERSDEVEEDERYDDLDEEIKKEEQEQARREEEVGLYQ